MYNYNAYMVSVAGNLECRGFTFSVMLFKVREDNMRGAAYTLRWGPSNYLGPLNKKEEK